MKKRSIILLMVAGILIITNMVSASAGAKVQFFNGNLATATNTLYLNFNLVNTGTDPVALSNVKMRYYFTNDGTQSNSFACDWSPVGSTNVTGTFANISLITGADRYLEVGFTSAAGTLAAGAGTEARIRVWKSDWSNFDQSNDYSFNPTATGYVDWTKVPAYISGTLHWGTPASGSVTPITPTGTITVTPIRTATPVRTATPLRTTTGARTATPTPVPTVSGDVPAIGTPVGWAAVNYLGRNGTTGGAGGTIIHVYDKAALEAAAYKDDNPAVIVVHGNLTGGPAMDTNVRSNKTIVGAGSGASLNFGLYLRGSNIIIKNLDIMNGGYNPGDSEGLDAITFAQDLHHVWVDHCTMHETMDGLVDPTRNARFVTVSYCYFHTQNTACLIGGSDSDSAALAAQSNSDKREWHYTCTFHHNYWTGINSRCPRVRFGPVHVFNNYYENLSSYAIGRGDRSNVYSEANYFYNSHNAFYAYDDSSNPGYVEDVGSLFEGSNGNTTDNPPTGSWVWTPGQYYPYTAHTAAWIKANLKNYCGIGKGNP
jgi:pectate lyase